MWELPLPSTRQTGEVRAMVSSPSYNPNVYSTRFTPDMWKKILSNPFRIEVNRAIQGMYSPGSVFKTVMGMAGFSKGVITPSTTFYCSGSKVFFGSRFRCWKREGHGAVDFERAIKVSCDIYFYEVGALLGIENIHEFATKLTWGSSTKIDLPGEKIGLVPSEEWAEEQGRKWYPSETISVAIGQGPLLMTILQTTNMMAAVANGGRVMRPHVLKAVDLVQPDGGAERKRVVPAALSEVELQPDALKSVRAGLWKVVNEAGGTGSNARIEGLDVSGKTGTVQVIQQATWIRTESLPFKYRDHAIFASFAPRDDPRLAVVVFVEHGGHGGSDAAPLAKQIYQAYFRGQIDQNKLNLEDPETLEQIRRGDLPEPGTETKDAMIDSRSILRLDFNLLGTTLVIAAIGVMAIYSATYFTSGSFYVQKQLIWIAISLVLLAIAVSVEYRMLMDISPVLYGIAMALLVYLLVWGKVTANVQSWIHLGGGFQFQPSEFMKIFTALVLAKFFDSYNSAYLDLRSFAIVAGIVGAPVALIAIQPDFGTAATFVPLMAAAMFFGGIKPRYWVIALLIAAIAIPVGWNFFLKPYQQERLLIFLDPQRDPLGSGYQVTQAKIAIGSGGITGKGFTQGTQAKLEFLPARHTDFIFAVVGEEWGFVGVTIVLALYLFLIIQSLTIAKQSRDRGGSFLVICLISFFVFHILINVAMQIGLLPDDWNPAAADFVWGFVDDDVLPRDRADPERGLPEVRERLRHEKTRRTLWPSPIAPLESGTTRTDWDLS